MNCHVMARRVHAYMYMHACIAYDCNHYYGLPPSSCIKNQS